MSPGTSSSETTIAPWLAVRDAQKAVDFYTAAFGGRPNAAIGPDQAALVVVKTFLDELLLHGSAVRVEAGELEVLLELEVHVVLATAVLLDRDDHPVAEALRLVRVELDVDLGDDVVLLVQDQDDVGLVVDRRTAAQVEVAQA